MASAKKTKSKSAAGAREQARPAAVVAAPPPTEALQWREQAAFHLTLDHATDAANRETWRTHAYHEESGEEQVWPGVLHQELLLWMCERTGMPVTRLPVSASAQAPAGAPEAEPYLDVGELVVEEIADEQPLDGSAIKRMRAHVNFRLSGAVASRSIEAVSHCAIQVLACERVSAQAIVLASSQRRLRPGAPSYTEALDFELPPLGDYQLLATVVLADEGLAGVVIGPVLTVVP